jgi:beta-N-acetylhexosaminidase
MRDWIQRHILGSAATAVIAVVVLIGWAVAALRGGPPPSSPVAAPSSVPASVSPAPSRATAPAATLTSAPAGAPSPRCALSLDQRVGQLLMIGAPVDDPRSLTEAVSTYHLGGVFLAGRSERRAAALRADIAALQGAAEVPLLVALDQEGGSVQTLKGPDFPLIPSASRLGSGPAAALRSRTADSATRLRGIGVSVNLAPVADTVPAAVGERNPPIGFFHRQYGSDPDQVAADIRTVVTTSQRTGVLTTVKHFPGLGRVLQNTDTSTGATDSTTSATDAYLRPFAAGIDAGTAAVMVSSATYPRLDRSAVAAFSAPVVTGLLREKLRFTGLVMSDDLGAAAAVRAVPAGERAVRFVRAGGDLVLTVRPQDARPMATALLAAAQRSPAFARRVTDAAAHVLAAKKKAGLRTCG